MSKTSWSKTSSSKRNEQKEEQRTDSVTDFLLLVLTAVEPDVRLSPKTTSACEDGKGRNLRVFV